jgi:hypothetical protein
MNEAKLVEKVRKALAKCKQEKGQGSLEYIMMLSAVSIVIVIALAMIVQLKGAAVHSFGTGAGNSIISQLANELSNISTT